MLFNNLSWKGGGIGLNRATRIDNSFHTESRPISDNHSKFSTPGIYELSFAYRANSFSVVPEICHATAATNIDMIADHTVTDIGKVWNSTLFSNITIFTFYK